MLPWRWGGGGGGDRCVVLTFEAEKKDPQFILWHWYGSHVWGKGYGFEAYPLELAWKPEGLEGILRNRNYNGPFLPWQR